MKLRRLIFLLAFLGLVVSCSNPTAPRFPEQDEDTGEGDPPPTQGLVLEAQETFWA